MQIFIKAGPEITKMPLLLCYTEKYWETHLVIKINYDKKL